MAYTHVRLRKTLALVRIAIGLLFVDLGWYKVSSIQYARVDFPQFLYDAISGGAIDFYGKFLTSYVLHNSTKVAVMIGFMEIFIGVSLVLGMLTRLVSLVGMFYMVNLMLATWYQPFPGEPLYHFPDEQWRHVVPFFLFLLFGIGHAGENWGLGALYHRRRHQRWERSWDIKMVSGLPPLPDEAQPQPARDGAEKPRPEPKLPEA